jgi:hypothetical protein
MIKWFNISVKCIAFFLFLSNSVVNGQILKDTSSVRHIKKGIGCIYNFQFKEANEVHNIIHKLYPGSPVAFLLKGMLTYWENYPLLPASSARVIFEEELRECIEICEKKSYSADEAEYLLTNLCARGLLLLFYSDNDLNLELFPLATSTYKYIRQSFDFTSVYSDFYYFTGLYNYTREVYPETYPIYKPLAILFPKGDKLKGIKDLQKASENSILLRAESLYFLSKIFLRFESNPQQATYYIKTLNELYPGNLNYKEEYIKNLLLIRKYDEAEKTILSLESKRDNLFFIAQLKIFKGIIMEKKYHDYKQARELYIDGVKKITLFGKYGDEFAAYAYFGLSRISESNGDKNYTKLYRKLANELADLKKVNFD